MSKCSIFWDYNMASTNETITYRCPYSSQSHETIQAPEAIMPSWSYQYLIIGGTN